MKWHEYKKELPQRDGAFMWCRNNWEATNIDGEHILRKSVRMAYWDTKVGAFADRTHRLEAPDYWGEVPEIEDAPIPNKYKVVSEDG